VNQIVPKEQQIAPALAGASSFALAFAGMIFGSLLSRPAETKLPEAAT